MLLISRLRRVASRYANDRNQQAASAVQEAAPDVLLDPAGYLMHEPLSALLDLERGDLPAVGRLPEVIAEPMCSLPAPSQRDIVKRDP